MEKLTPTLVYNNIIIFICLGCYNEGPQTGSLMTKMYLFLINFIDFLQRGRERDRELETSVRNIDQLPPTHALLGMCP